jgi:hypothetical protein
MATPHLSRRDWLKLSTAGVVSYSLSGWLETLAADIGHDPRRRRSCILLWMNGGPSQTDTFDLKPGHPNGGPFKEIATAVPGIRISEHLPQLARHTKRMALIRSMSTREGDHTRATFYMRTGYKPRGSFPYPALGSLVAKELGHATDSLPSFVSIAPNRLVNPAAYSAGFLGPRYAPLVVGDVRSFFGGDDTNYSQALQVPDLRPLASVSPRHEQARIDLLRSLETDFVGHHPGVPAQGHHTACERAVQLMEKVAAKAFNLDEEPAALRNRYGRNLFGQGCLLARRLVERGVPFVEVSLGAANGVPVGWDTHAGNFDAVRRLSQVLDPAWATLMQDLQDHGLLDSTLIVWMGEFGRTPAINKNAGRDHFPTAWSTVLAGGGIKGGQVVGRTSTDGTRAIERPVSVPDLLATVCLALGIDPMKQNPSPGGRPIRIVDKDAHPIREVLA